MKALVEISKDHSILIGLSYLLPLPPSEVGIAFSYLKSLVVVIL